MSSEKGGLELSEMLFFAGIALLMIGMFLYSSHFYVFANVWRQIRIAELTLLEWIPLWMQNVSGLEVDKSIRFLKVVDGRQLSQDTINKFDTYWSRRLSIIPGIFFVWSGVRFIRKSDRATRIYNNETLLQRQTPFFDHIKPYVNTNPEKMDIKYRRGDATSMAHSMGLSPFEFSTMNPPLGLEAEAKSNKLYQRAIYIPDDEDFDDDLAERAFIKQLGRPYQGIDSMSAVERQIYDSMIKDIPWSRENILKLVSAMLRAIESGQNGFSTTLRSEQRLFDAIAASKANASPEGATTLQKIKGAFSGSFAKFLSGGGKERLNRFDEDSCLTIIDDPSYLPMFRSIEAERIMNKHSYVRTGLMSVLVRLREGGTYPAAKYKDMLKPHDRVLWYALSSVGRDVSFVEAAGPFCHWLVEVVADRALPRPEVSVSVEGLRTALKLAAR